MESEVTVTHFINPHLFWFKTIEADDPENVHMLCTLEQNLEQLYKNKPTSDSQLRPEVGDKVAVNFIARNKFIRAEVLQKAEFQQEEYIVWAIDYGFPLLTKKDYLRYLPTNLRQDIGLIHVGGIANTYPAEQEYDDEEGNLVLVKKDNWLQRTCNMLEKLLMDASSISFVLNFQDTSNHYWGNLIVVNHRGNKINALDFLLKTTNAIRADDVSVFQEKIFKLNTTKIAPWLSNDRKTKMKFNTIKHNYAEHSQQMVATIIDEQAKRKVQDWQKRNEIGADNEFAEMPELSYVETDNNVLVDDITFDDSVSVVQEKNYMGKAGAITKNKHKTHIPNKDLSPSVLQKAFQMDNIKPLEAKVNSLPQPSETSLSTSSSISNRMQKLALLRSSCARMKEKNKHVAASESSLPQSHASEKNESSSITSNSIRHQRLLEMRRKAANAEKQKKDSDDLKNLQHLNEKQNLCATESTIKTLDSYSYHLLEQSTSLSTLNPLTVKQSQDINKSGVSQKEMGALPTKLDSSATTSKNNENDSSVEEVKLQKDKFAVKGNNILIKNETFELKQKAFAKVEHTTTQTKDVALSEENKETINEKLKLDQLGPDSITMVPAGFDITRLNAYKDEKTHWHRKKTTRNDSVKHDNSTTSSEDFKFSFGKNDRSFSSSDFSTNHPDQNSSSKNKSTNISKYSNQYEANQTSANFMNVGKSLTSSRTSA